MSAQFDSIIGKWSSVFSVPGALIKAIIRVESNFNPNAANPNSSAKGLMQMIEGTWKWMGNAAGNIFNPDDNIEAGSRYLAFNLKRRNGDLEGAVADYYAGTAYKDESGRWYRKTKNGKDYSVDSYVQKVMGWYSKYSGGTYSSPQQTTASDTGPSSGGSGTDIGLFVLAGVVGLLFLKRLIA